MSAFKSSCVHGVHRCFCTDTRRLPLVSSPGCSDDLAAVLALPNQWTPRRCGPTLTNYLKERKSNHENALNDLLKQASVFNKDIDDKIRELSEILIADIESNQKDFNCIAERFRLKELPLSVEDRNDALRQISNLANQRIQDVAKYKIEAHAMERQRAEGLKSILQSHFQKLISIGHCSPKELLHDFDERIFGINQQLLSNSRAYAELEAFLRAQLDESIVQLRSSINQLCLTSEIKTRHQSASSWNSLTENRVRKRSSSASCETAKRYSVESTHSIKIDLDEFQNCVASLVGSYRGAVVHIFQSFSNFFEELQSNIGKIKHFNEKDSKMFNMKEMTDRAMNRLSDSEIKLSNFMNREVAEMTRNDVFLMQQSLLSLGERLRSTYMILHDASLLLNPHMLRSALAQKLTVTAVEDMQTSYDILELANETAINISLEQLCCASDADKVQQQYNVIMNFFDKITESHDKHREAEIVKFEDYMNLQPLLANTLLSEYVSFIDQNPKSSYSALDSRITESYTSIRPISFSSLRATLPKAMMQTKLQETALTYWKNGFLESFESNIRFIPQELSHQARKWVDEKILLVNMRYSLKQMSQSVRIERVQAARDIRLAEVRFHETRLNNHLEALHDFESSVLKEASEFLSLDAQELYPICRWVEDIQHKLDDLQKTDPVDLAVKRLKMASYSARLTRHQQLFEESLNLKIEQFKRNLEVRFQTVRTSNLEFISKLKLFKEGGRYSSTEILKTSSALIKESDALESCVSRTFDVLNSRRTQLLTQAEELLSPLRKAVEDVKRPNERLPFEIKKPRSNKKK